MLIPGPLIQSCATRFLKSSLFRGVNVLEVGEANAKVGGSFQPRSESALHANTVGGP